MRAHVPALDGLRGAAIFLVLLLHVAVYHRMTDDTLVDRVVYRVFLSGWCGVDLFFVLSGFLITGILLDTRAEPKWLFNFYGRRFLRIFPPYYIFLTLYFVVLPRVPPHIVPPEMGAQGWYWSYLANVRDAIVGWKDIGLAHFWSLAVEEQFYVVWPFVVGALAPRTLKRVCVAMVVVAPLVRIAFWATNHEVAAYVLTPCRLDSLGAGAFVALLQREGLPRETILRWAKRAGGGAAVAALAIVLTRRTFSDFDPLVYTLGISVTAIGFGALVAGVCFANEGANLPRALSLRPLRALGKYSYGLYIIHVPILWIMVMAGVDLRSAKRIGGSAAPALLLDLAVGTLLMFTAAWVSWHLYEKRVLELKRFFGGERGASPARTRDASANL